MQAVIFRMETVLSLTYALHVLAARRARLRTTLRMASSRRRSDSSRAFFTSYQIR